MTEPQTTPTALPPLLAALGRVGATATDATASYPAYPLYGSNRPPRIARRIPAGDVPRPRPAHRAPQHLCPLPDKWPVDAEPGTPWRCPELHLWVVGDACGACRAGAPVTHGGQHMVGRAWWPASLLQLVRFGGFRATLDMANGNRFSLPPLDAA